MLIFSVIYHFQLKEKRKEAKKFNMDTIEEDTDPEKVPDPLILLN